jgi:hypothetical protein
LSDRLRAVIFDYSTLLVPADNAVLVADLRTMLETLKGFGLKIVVFSTYGKAINKELARRGMPPCDLFVCSANLGGAKKGAVVWTSYTAEQLGIRPNQLLYIGDGDLDWRTALNGGVLYLGAKWSQEAEAEQRGLLALTPERVVRFATHFLLQPARFEYSLDIGDVGLRLRSLLSANARLPATNPATFSLQDVLTYRIPVTVRRVNARDYLMLHAVSSLYLEGLVPPQAVFAVYPSSTFGKRSGPILEYMDLLKRYLRINARDDLLVRGAQARDTSRIRAEANKRHEHAVVSFTEQTNSVYVNAARRTLIQGKTVIVCDDFTTSGMSLEWARNLLLAAGAGEVILLTIGKYSSRHTVYCAVRDGLIDPFHLTSYEEDMFEPTTYSMVRDVLAPARTIASFRALKAGESLSVVGPEG